MKYTLIDVTAYFLNGLIVGLLIWFMHSSYKNAEDHGYTPSARAHMNELVAAYSEPDWDSVPRLSVNDLK